MRSVIQVVIAVCALAWVYDQHPKLFQDVFTAFRKDSPPTTVRIAPLEMPSENFPKRESEPQSPQPAVPEPAESVSDISDGYVPPSPLPAQPNWTWTTTEGNVYKNVVIVSAEADSVTIMTSDGGGRIAMAVLPEDIQKLLHYNPLLAKRAAAQRNRDDSIALSTEIAERNAIHQKREEDKKNGINEQEAAAANLQKARENADRQGQIINYTSAIAESENTLDHLRKAGASHGTYAAEAQNLERLQAKLDDLIKQQQSSMTGSTTATATP